LRHRAIPPPIAPCEARGDHKQAAHYYRLVIDFVRAHPDQYEPAFETIFLRLIEELDPIPAD
jgi:hypothetical protein